MLQQNFYEQILSKTLTSLIALFLVFMIKSVFFKKLMVGNLLFIQALNWFRVPFLRGAYYSKWSLSWDLNDNDSHSKEFQEINTYEVQMYHFIKYIGFKFDSNDQEYIFFGNISNPNMLTGRWYSSLKNGYHGNFQCYISPAFNKLEGKWMGFNSKNEIIANKLCLQKLNNIN